MNEDQSLSQNQPNVFSETKRVVTDTARDAVGQVKEQAAEAAKQRKSGLADQIDSYGSAVDKSAEAWEQEDPNIAWVTHQVADRLKRASEYVRRTDFAQIKRDSEDVARQHPALFFGGLFLAGVVVGNMLKATASSAASKSSSDQASTDSSVRSYPVQEDVVSTQGEAASWPDVPVSEAVK